MSMGIAWQVVRNIFLMSMGIAWQVVRKIALRNMAIKALLYVTFLHATCVAQKQTKLHKFLVFAICTNKATRTAP